MLAAFSLSRDLLHAPLKAEEETHGPYPLLVPLAINNHPKEPQNISEAEPQNTSEANPPFSFQSVSTIENIDKAKELKEELIDLALEEKESANLDVALFIAQKIVDEPIEDIPISKTSLTLVRLPSFHFNGKDFILLHSIQSLFNIREDYCLTAISKASQVAKDFVDIEGESKEEFLALDLETSNQKFLEALDVFNLCLKRVAEEALALKDEDFEAKLVELGSDKFGRNVIEPNKINFDMGAKINLEHKGQIEADELQKIELLDESWMKIIFWEELEVIDVFIPYDMKLIVDSFLDHFVSFLHVIAKKNPMEGIFGSPVDGIANSQARSSRKPTIDSMCGGCGDKNASQRQASEDTLDQQKAEKRAEKRADVVEAQGDASKESAELPLKPELSMNKDVEDAEKSSEKPIEKDTIVNLSDEDVDLLISDVCGEILGRRKKRSNTEECATPKKKAKNWIGDVQEPDEMVEDIAAKQDAEQDANVTPNKVEEDQEPAVCPEIEEILPNCPGWGYLVLNFCKIKNLIILDLNGLFVKTRCVIEGDYNVFKWEVCHNMVISQDPMVT
ncbi:hypothetical protein L7F22_004019 [Adiantum nelumboides]|nr:hypothetical protein [Adiantum nelumboides]